MTTPPAGSIAYLTVAKLNRVPTRRITDRPATGAADNGTSSAGRVLYVYNMAIALTPGTYYCQITLKAADGTVLGQSLKQYFVLRS